MIEEVFAERVTLQRRQDIPAYVNYGGPIREYVSSHRSLHRARLDLKSGGVSWEFCASFHARIIAYEIGNNGERLAVLFCRGANGRAFWFRCPLLWLTSGKAHHARRFYSAMHRARGFVGSGSFVFPGKLSATIRAILALSAEGEPMPCDLGELDGLKSELSPDERNDFWDDGI